MSTSQTLSLFPSFWNRWTSAHWWTWRRVIELYWKLQCKLSCRGQCSTDSEMDEAFPIVVKTCKLKLVARLRRRDCQRGSYHDVCQVDPILKQFLVEICGNDRTIWTHKGSIQTSAGYDLCFSWGELPQRLRNCSKLLQRQPRHWCPVQWIHVSWWTRWKNTC